MKNLITIGEAAALAGVSIDTLRRMPSLTVSKTSGGHRRYSRDEIEKLKTQPQTPKPPTTPAEQESQGKPPIQGLLESERWKLQHALTVLQSDLRANQANATALGKKIADTEEGIHYLQLAIDEKIWIKKEEVKNEQKG